MGTATSDADNSLGLEELKLKLNSVYDREEELVRELEQLRDDKEMLQTVIMHQFNKHDRIKELKECSED